MSTYTIDVHADGTATVHVWTDDNFDLGYPTETATWDLHYASFADALRYAGGTRTSLYGQPIDVVCNGMLIDRAGHPTTSAPVVGGAVCVYGLRDGAANPARLAR